MKKIRPSRIIKGTVKNILGEETDYSEQRLLICKNCPENKKGICGICGCLLTSKTKVKEEYCPMNKWNDIKVLKKIGISIGIQNPERASISIDEENNEFIFNYGTIKKDSDTKLYLLITNDRGNYFTENQNLTKLDYRTVCSCTVGTTVPKELKEGQSFNFEVSYDSKRIGVFSKRVTFSSDETAFKIILKGEVV